MTSKQKPGSGLLRKEFRIQNQGSATSRATRPGNFRPGEKINFEPVSYCQSLFVTRKRPGFQSQSFRFSNYC